ncbi:type II toxin-antitoxin system PemK/MazF family toxin [Synechocystis salina LEGE 06155]|nr:type II toxin-antitoxin system PemK/MazF family toxin [Synechocystis salina LEGE 06155]
MPLSKGDIVLVPFPFSNLSQTKLRPAVILWVDSQGKDITVCFISSQNIDQISLDEVDLTPENPEFSETGLKVASKIKVTKIVTIERQLIQRRLGKLGEQNFQQFNRALEFAFQLD